VGLADYWRVLRRQWFVVLLCLVLGVLGALAYVQWAPKEYRATTSVVVLGTDRGTAAANNINLDTEAQLVTATGTAAAAAELLDLPSSQGRELADRVSISVPPNSDILDITYTDATAAEAREGSAAFAQAYLDQREQTTEAVLDAEREALQTRIDELQTQLDATLGTVSRLPEGSANRRRASAQVGLLNNQIAALGSQVNQLSTVTVSPGRIVTEAALPSAPSGPNAVVVLAAGVVLGLLVGAGAAALRSRADDTIRRPQDLFRRTNVPVASVLSGRLHDGQVDVLPPLSADGRGYARLRNLVTASLTQADRRVVVVAGVRHGGGPVAVNLAASLARAGEDVFLVCADVFGPTTRALLGSRPTPGLSEVLSGEVTVADAVRSIPGAPTLKVLGVGRDPDRADAQLQTRSPRRLIEQLVESGAYVVIEAPATSDSADAQTLANVAAIAVLVVELDHAGATEVLDACAQFESMGTPVLGAVVARYGKGGDRGSEVPTARTDVETPKAAAKAGPGARADAGPGRHDTVARGVQAPAEGDGSTVSPGVRDAAPR
jgi:Mrp family chromosome partitioning ATPase